MKILVQKFGGTSVATPERREMVAGKILSAVAAGFVPVVVISAIGRSGDSYATDTLIDLAKSSGKTAPREMDLLMSCGEVISCVVVAGTLTEHGLKTVVLTGGQAGIHTDSGFGDATILEVDGSRIVELLAEGCVPVVAGFQGVDPKGNITTLGRGGSDVTAAILGEALEAEAVEIYTDVEGIMTADPRIVPEARIMDAVNYNEVFQMAEYGAKVIHPRAVEIAMRSHIPMYIKSTLTDHPGTLITGHYPGRNYKAGEDSRLITAVAHVTGRCRVRIDFHGARPEIEKDELLFGRIAEAGVSIDMINISPDQKVFTIEEKDCEALSQLLGSMDYEHDILGGMGKVTVIGSRMRGVPGVMARTVKALGQAGIRIHQTSDSSMTISCLVEGVHLREAVIALHKEYGLES
jgi:aspartate kinase